MSIKEKTAIVLLAYADYESLELTLAAYATFIKNDEKLFILQNGRGTYDCERTYRVAKRYASLYPRNIEVVDDIPQGYPYYSIKSLLASERMQKYDYICKVDDDCFPLTRTWFDDLCTCYEDSAKTYGDSLGYVTSLVNNNPWGFDKILDIFEKREEFFDIYAREHRGGGKGYGTERIYGKNEIHTGCCGTVWGNAYISRWVHRFSTMAPEEYVQRTANLGYAEVDNTKRYSINCMLFRKEFWNAIDMDSHDDEHQCFMYCKENDKKIIANMSIPMVHLMFFIQREENRTLIPEIKRIYDSFLNSVYPISICDDKLYEIENRLRHIETILSQKENFDTVEYYKNKILSKICFGSRRKYYKEKYRKMKKLLRH